MSKGMFITGTGTDVGKSFATAFLLKTIGKNYRTLYYKPIQCGLPSDVDFMKTVAGNKKCASTYNLKTPSSPHFAFAKEGVEFDKNSVKKFLIQAKKDYDFILMEGAGGVRVPITDSFDMADLAKLSGFPAMVIATPTLGTINHTLLTIDYLKAKKVKIKGFMFSWQKESEESSHKEMIIDNAKTISRLSGVKFEGSVPELKF
ncbi:dethiobiotin synthase [Fibrobacterales bacterium]|nr:dethiobiotin synthase [Fibrobacterales bacterium]